MYVTYDIFHMTVVSKHIEGLSQPSSAKDSTFVRHALECRSDVAKLTVIYSRIRDMVQDVQQLQRFLSQGITDSSDTHAFIKTSLHSSELMFEGILATIMREQRACVAKLERKVPGNDSSGKTSTGVITRLQVDDTWCPGSILSFISAGIEYQVKPPADTKPGDWLEFDPNTCILMKLDR
jgi:hypothetical protein